MKRHFGLLTIVALAVLAAGPGFAANQAADGVPLLAKGGRDGTADQAAGAAYGDTGRAARYTDCERSSTPAFVGSVPTTMVSACAADVPRNPAPRIPTRASCPRPAASASSSPRSGRIRASTRA